jgi:hypothetical protein
MYEVASFTEIHRQAQAPLIEDDPSERIICIDWRPCERNTLRGFCRITIPSWCLTMDGVAIHESHGRKWAQLPARPQLDGSGNLVHEPSGKIKYARILNFTDKQAERLFSDWAVSAVERFCR